MVGIGAAVDEGATVRPATMADVPRVASVLATAFHDDPAVTWLLHGDPNRLRILERGFALYLREVWIDQEVTYTTGNVVGAAVWELPGHWKLGAAAQLRLLPGFLRATGRHVARALRSQAKLESNHPEEPHYYLPFVGVNPDWQGRGLGAALMAPILDRCDRQGLPAYLDATAPRNRALYERHGFTVTEEFTLGKGSPPLWRMWRLPRGG
jgi:GNAT superfamily N-acetyltransferase